MDKFIIDNATFVTRKEIEEGICQLLTDFLRNYSTENLLMVNLVSSKIGSEHWLYLKIRPLLPSHSLITPTMAEELAFGEGEYDVFFIDDWLLSGCNACTNFENVFYGKKIPDNTKINCYFFSYFSTDRAMSGIDRLISGFYKKIKHIQTIHKYLKKLEPLSQVAKDHFTQKEITDFDTQYDNYDAFLIWSDYKIPNEFGTYPGILKRDIDRSFMTKVVDQFKSLDYH